MTHGPWEVTRIEGIDTRTHTVYYTGTEASPLERQLYAVRFDGSHARRLTTSDGDALTSTCRPTRGTTSTAGRR